VAAAGVSCGDRLISIAVGAGVLELRLGLAAALGAGDLRKIAIRRQLAPKPFDKGLRAEKDLVSELLPRP
jgi:hypothetical protein